MRKDKHYFINNEGSALIIIIVCVAFLTLLSSLLLTVTLNNVQMKNINKKSKANFYDAETALAEVRAGIEEVTADSLEIAYNKAMENYLDETIDKGSLFSQTFVTEIAKKLGYGIALTTYNTATIQRYIKNPNAQIITNVSIGENKIEIDEKNPSNPGYLIIKNIKLSYINSENYKTTLSTDIKITVPSMAFHASKGGTNVFADYGLIADHSISLNTANPVKVYGNAYAGDGGIALENASSLTMGQGSNIITRGNIDVKNRSILQILDNPNIWAKNITTSQNVNTGTELPTTIQINGKCYVENDLTLGAKKSNVTLSGEYYGYGNEHIPDKSSAIIINGLKSTLNLSNLNRLLIAGRAYLDPSTGGNEYNKTQGNIQTGESLAIRGNQYAYLVPSECLWRDVDSNSSDPKNVGNPVSYDKYLKRENKTDGLGNIPMVSLTPEIAGYANGYTTVFYSHGTRKEVFFFLTFANEEKANEYLKNYYSKQQLDEGSKMESRIKSFASSISVNTASSLIMSPGHILTYQEESGVGLVESTVTADGSTVQSMTDQLKERYKVLSQELSELHLGNVHNTSSVFDSIIDTSKIPQSTNKVYTIDNGKYEAHVVGGNFDTTSGMQGIVIATGNVTVHGSFTGLILAGGDIILLPDSTVTASKQVVNSIINKNTELNTFFRNVVVNNQGEAGNLADNGQIIVSELIGYENWKLNEE